MILSIYLHSCTSSLEMKELNSDTSLLLVIVASFYNVLAYSAVTECKLLLAVIEKS